MFTIIRNYRLMVLSFIKNELNNAPVGGEQEYDNKDLNKNGATTDDMIREAYKNGVTIEELKAIENNFNIEKAKLSKDVREQIKSAALAISYSTINILEGQFNSVSPDKRADIKRQLDSASLIKQKFESDKVEENLKTVITAKAVEKPKVKTEEKGKIVEKGNTSAAEKERKIRVNELIKKYRGEKGTETVYEKNADIKKLYETTINISRKTTKNEMDAFENAMKSLDSKKTEVTPKIEKIEATPKVEKTETVPNVETKEAKAEQIDIKVNVKDEDIKAAINTIITGKASSVDIGTYSYKINGTEVTNKVNLYQFDGLKVQLSGTAKLTNLFDNIDTRVNNITEINTKINELVKEYEKKVNLGLKEDFDDKKVIEKNDKTNAFPREISTYKDFDGIDQKIILKDITHPAVEGMVAERKEYLVELDNSGKFIDPDVSFDHIPTKSEIDKAIKELLTAYNKEKAKALKDKTDKKTKEAEAEKTDAEKFKADVLKNTITNTKENQSKTNEKLADEISAKIANEKFSVKDLLGKEFKDIDAQSKEMSWLREFLKSDLTKEITLDDIKVDVEKGIIEFSFDDSLLNESFNQGFKVNFDKKNFDINTFKTSVSEKAKEAVLAKANPKTNLENKVK